MAFPSNYYEILRVSSKADISELKTAFRYLSKKFHPDTTSISPDVASKKFHAVCEAYNLLSDPVLRAKYDEFICKESMKSKQDSVFNSSLNSLEETGSLASVRRSLSGGELFSLTLLGISFLICIGLSIVFAILQGKELLPVPDWMIVIN